MKRVLADAPRYLSFAAALISLTQPLVAPAAAPTLYSQPTYQSPVRAEPDDLLLLPGYGFAPTDIVVYQALTDTTQPLDPPTSVPVDSDAVRGVAEIVSDTNVPDSLTIKLPAFISSGQSYALWVRNGSAEWSNGIKINDARALWISPSYVYATETVASLPRYLKVIGRNLEPAPGAVTRIRLTGPSIFTLDASNDADPSTAVERYVAKVDLPASLPAGDYTVQVSRDGVSWVTLEGQTLAVKADPNPVLATFPLDAQGCAPNDGLDDTVCIKQAIAAAKAAGGGVVVFSAGEWLMNDSVSAGLHVGWGLVNGIEVPVGVSLRGAGAAVTTLVRGIDWGPATVFTLQGRNTVEGFTFKDLTDWRVTQPSSGYSVIFQLGKKHYTRNAPGGVLDPRELSSVVDVTITNNIFDKPRSAFVDGALPIERLFVTYNEFGGYATAFSIGGDDRNQREKFRVDNSVIAYNVFKPGSYLNLTVGQGTMATDIGASLRLDFSHNFADGASTAYLYDPVNDARGWRAAFFWTLRNNQEMTLVSQNSATCTGDKIGDGEAIAFDNNHNQMGFARAQSVAAATATTVTVPGPLFDKPTDYYVGHWVHLAEGPGVGQARKIVSYVTDAAGAPTFTVSPAWDVLPQTSSRLTIARQFWHTYTIDNFVDHRTPLCQKGNRNVAPSSWGAGTIGMRAQAADSVIEGNRQYDTTGIVFNNFYSAEPIGAEETASCGGDCRAGTSYLYSFEVRGNTIEREYNWDSDCSRSGIAGIQGASPTPSSPPPVVNYGMSIAHNTVTQADGLRGGAITLPLGWHGGPPPGGWKLISNALIYHNTVRDLAGPGPSKACDNPQPNRIGINLHDPTVWRSVLYANACNNVTVPLNDAGTGTVRACRSGVLNSCECAEPDLALTIATNRDAVFTGDDVVYTLQVTNNGAAAASGVVVTDKLPSGLTWISTGATQGNCNGSSTITCDLGNLANGAAATVTITARAAVAGTFTNAASVAGAEYDPDGANNSATITVTATDPISGGLRGDYYDNADFSAYVLSRVDPTVNFKWSESPIVGLSADTFSVRWTGKVKPEFSETYTFYTRSNDGVRLWVKGQLLIDNWAPHATVEDRATIALTAGQLLDIAMEFYDNTGLAVAKLRWSSPSRDKQVIPKGRLYH